MDCPGFRGAYARMTSPSHFGGHCLGFMNFEGRLPSPSASTLDRSSLQFLAMAAKFRKHQKQIISNTYDARRVIASVVAQVKHSL
jgi:hypothetical protein